MFEVILSAIGLKLLKHQKLPNLRSLEQNPGRLISPQSAAPLIFLWLLLAGGQPSSSSWTFEWWFWFWCSWPGQRWWRGTGSSLVLLSSIAVNTCIFVLAIDCASTSTCIYLYTCVFFSQILAFVPVYLWISVIDYVRILNCKYLNHKYKYFCNALQWLHIIPITTGINAIPDLTKKSGQRLVGDVDYKEVTLKSLPPKKDFLWYWN